MLTEQQYRMWREGCRAITQAVVVVFVRPGSVLVVFPCIYVLLVCVGLIDTTPDRAYYDAVFRSVALALSTLLVCAFMCLLLCAHKSFFVGARVPSSLVQVRIETLSQLYRLAEFGRLSGGIFHDLMTPLTAISLSVASLRNNTRTNTAAVGECVTHTVTAAKQIQELLGVAKSYTTQGERCTTFYVDNVVTQAMHILEYKARSAQVRMCAASSEKHRIYSDPGQLYQVVSNLLSNAIDAYEGATGIHKKIVAVRVTGTSRVVRLVVEDYGVGIHLSDLSHIFEPCYTTKSPDKGTGIGLATVKYVVEEQLHGCIGVTSAPGKGSVFTVYLPRKMVKT